MIDLPNDLAAFVLGVVATLLFWIPDRIKARRQRQDDLWQSWKVAMKDLEIMMWKPETRASDIYSARNRYPIDHWRTVLKEREGFLLLERVEGAYSTIDQFANQSTADASSEKNARFLRAQGEWASARIAFANYSRNAQSEGYDLLVRREERQRNRRDLLRHPIKTAQLLRHNASMKKSVK